VLLLSLVSRKVKAFKITETRQYKQYGVGPEILNKAGFYFKNGFFACISSEYKAARSTTEDSTIVRQSGDDTANAVIA